MLLLLGVAVALWSPRATDEGAAVTCGRRRGRLLGRRRPQPRPPTAAVAPRPGRRSGWRCWSPRSARLIAQGSSDGIKISFGLAALVCGVGLLVGTLAGRARWLVVPAALLAGVSVAGAAIEDLGVSLRGSRQSTTYVTAGADTPIRRRPTSTLPAGTSTSSSRPSSTPSTGGSGWGTGSVQISAASDVRLEVRVQVGLGSIDMPNGSEDGYRRVATYADGPSDAPLVRYDIAVGFGSIEVDRFRPGAPPLTAEPARRGGPVQSDGDGGLVFEDGAHQLADGSIYLLDGTMVSPSDGADPRPAGQHAAEWRGDPARRYEHRLRTAPSPCGPASSSAPCHRDRSVWRRRPCRPSLRVPRPQSVPDQRPGGDDPPDSDLGRGGPTVKRHPLDPVSLVLGLLVVVVAIAALSGRLGELLNEPGRSRADRRRSGRSGPHRLGAAPARLGCPGRRG